VRNFVKKVLFRVKSIIFMGFILGRNAQVDPERLTDQNCGPENLERLSTLTNGNAEIKYIRL